MNWNIKARLTALGCTACLGAVLLAGSAAYVNESLRASVHLLTLRQEQTATIAAMRQNTVGLMLNAMDSIIDKDEGKISQERMDSINERLKALEEMAPKLVELADTEEESLLAGQVTGKVTGLRKGILGDLKSAIENNASDEAFAKIDDILDENGAELDVLLARIETSVRRELVEAAEQEKADLNRSNWIIGLTLLALLAAVVPFTFWLVRSITRPMRNLTMSMGELAQGRADLEVPGLALKDELGEMAQAVEVFRKNAVRMQELESEKEENERKAREERRSAMLAMADAFESDVLGIVREVSGTATGVETSAQEITGMVERASSQSRTADGSAKETTGNVQTVAAATEELAASIQEIARQISAANQISDGAVGEAEQATLQVRTLAEASQRIGEVVNLINDVAGQTNLLALNATIEAARAGEAGKGFAVVASEVKNLASQTAKATEEIAGQISSIQGATADAVKAIEGISQTIHKIKEFSNGVAAAVEEQEAATADISRNVQAAAHGSETVSRNVAEVEELSSTAGKSSSAMHAAAHQLVEQAGRMNEQISAFLNQLRAA